MERKATNNDIQSPDTNSWYHWCGYIVEISEAKPIIPREAYTIRFIILESIAGVCFNATRVYRSDHKLNHRRYPMEIITCYFALSDASNLYNSDRLTKTLKRELYAEAPAKNDRKIIDVTKQWNTLVSRLYKLRIFRNILADNKIDVNSLPMAKRN